jgi:hypothetical protein
VNWLRALKEKLSRRPHDEPESSPPLFQEPNESEERAKWVQEQGEKRDDPPDRFEPV